MFEGQNKQATPETAATGRSDHISPPNEIRTLHVKFDNWKWRKASIFDSDQQIELYRLECHTPKPQIIMLPPSSTSSQQPTPAPIGEASFHSLTSRIDTTLHNRNHTIALTSRGALKDGFTYDSPAHNWAKLTWQSQTKWDYFKMVLLDETAMPVARIAHSSWSMTKAATIELLREKAGHECDGELMDEIVLTGLAVLTKRLINYSAA